MKKLAVLTAATCLIFTACAQKPNRQTMPNTKQDTISYLLGRDMMRFYQDNEIEINPQSFMQGVSEVMNGKESMVSDEDAARIMQEFQQDVQTRMAQKQATQAAQNKAKGIEFLSENKKRAEVKSTESGLQYEVIKEGKGKKPSKTSRVTVHYTGKLIDGTVFDSSVERNQPATFGLNQVIPGWTEGLQLMSEGSKYILYIPASLGYGNQPVGNIPPSSTLIFEVELLKIEE